MDTFLVDEAVRVLKKGGFFIVTTPTPMAKSVLEFLSYRMHLIIEESIQEHQHYYAKKELVELMVRHGCKIIKYQKFQLGFNQLIIAEKE